MPYAMAMPRRDGQRELASRGSQAGAWEPEEKHLARCIESLAGMADTVVVADCCLPWFPSSAWEPSLGRSGFLSVRGWDALRYGHARHRPAGAGKRGSQAGAWESGKPT